MNSRVCVLRAKSGDDQVQRGQAIRDERVRWLRMPAMTPDSWNEFYRAAPEPNSKRPPLDAAPAPVAESAPHATP